MKFCDIYLSISTALLCEFFSLSQGMKYIFCCFWPFSSFLRVLLGFILFLNIEIVEEEHACYNWFASNAFYDPDCLLHVCLEDISANFSSMLLCSHTTPKPQRRQSWWNNSWYIKDRSVCASGRIVVLNFSQLSLDIYLRCQGMKNRILWCIFNDIKMKNKRIEFTIFFFKLLNLLSKNRPPPHL